jgi:small subunit ribosomal protein S6
LRDYELIFIVQPELDDEGLNAVVERVEAIIKGQGGEVSKTDPWGKRRLAYPIRRYQEGYYVRMEARLQPDSVREIEHDFGLTEDLLRHLFVRMSEVSDAASASSS